MGSSAVLLMKSLLLHTNTIEENAYVEVEVVDVALLAINKITSLLLFIPQ